MKDIQEKLIESIGIVVNERINQTNYTASKIGVVRSARAFDCEVEIQESIYQCVLMEHLHDWIQEDDIVIVQDLFNDSTRKAVIGKIGTTRNTSFTIYDENKGKAISGVDVLYDDNLQEVVDVALDIEKGDS